MDFIPDKLENAVVSSSDKFNLLAATAAEVLEAFGDLVNDIRDGRLEVRISIRRSGNDQQQT